MTLAQPIAEITGGSIAWLVLIPYFLLGGQFAERPKARRAALAVVIVLPALAVAHGLWLLLAPPPLRPPWVIAALLWAGVALGGFFTGWFVYWTTRAAREREHWAVSIGLKLLVMYAVPGLVVCAALLVGYPLVAVGVLLAMVVLRWIIRW